MSAAKIRRETPRRGFSALEVLVSSALLAAAFVPIVAAIHSSARVARLDEWQVLASRRVRRALASLQGRPYHAVLDAATGEAPPTDLDDRLSPEAREIPLDLATPEEDASILGSDPGELEVYRRRASTMPVRAFVEELEPGLARVTALVTWVDPHRGTRRHRVAAAFHEAPFHWRRER